MDDSARPSRFLRQYALTQGRVHSIGRDLPLDTLVQVSAVGRARVASLPREQAAVLELSTEPVSIAEISAHLHVHLGIARVLVSDLCADASVTISAAEFTTGEGPDLETLERLLDDLTIF
jgi:hypothetical protein